MSIDLSLMRKPTSARRAALLICLTALLLGAAPPAGAQAPVASEVLLEVKRFEIVGNNPLPDAETATVLAPHLGAHRSLGTLEAAATALESRLRERGFSFHRVIVPAQKPAAGVVKLEILQFPLATVAVVGNKHFSADNIRRSLPGLAAGTSPDVLEMSRELGLAAEHPAKQVAVVLKESTTADALDADIRVRDVNPQQFFTSFTEGSRDTYNSTNHSTGYSRLTVGYQNANLFDRDHVLTASYTSSPEHHDRVNQYGVFYWLPFYGYATSLQVYYTHSDVRTGSVGIGLSSFNVSGTGDFFGARLTHSLPKYGAVTQNVALSIDDRYFKNDVGVEDVSLPTASVRSRPLALRYTARLEQDWGGVGAYAEPVSNLGGGSANTDSDYDAARPGAKRNWNAFRYGIDASYALGSWGLSARLRGQETGAELIPGEQFGLGGIGSVRGLRDREFSGDRGYSVNLEALGPALTGGVRPLVFFDFGSARVLGASGDATGRDSASSIGVGMRANWERRLDVSADLAYVLNGITSTDSVAGTKTGHLKLTFAAFYRF
jgi:hemolysin activation/secretion protein